MITLMVAKGTVGIDIASVAGLYLPLFT